MDAKLAQQLANRAKERSAKEQFEFSKVWKDLEQDRLQ